MSEQRFVLLRKEDPLAWALMPHVLDRIEKFCNKHQTDVNGKELVKIVQRCFVEENPLVICAAAYEKGQGVFAHALASIDNITGTKFLTIMQMETDRPFADREAMMDIWRQLRIWGLNHMANEARLVTRTPAQVRMFEQYYGFKQHRIMMLKSLMED
jgi:hypothetical protein